MSDTGELRKIMSIQDDALTGYAERCQKAIEKAIHADREKLAGLVEEKIVRARNVQAIRKADNKDTTIQDCKIDAWESVLNIIHTTEIGE